MCNSSSDDYTLITCDLQVEAAARTSYLFFAEGAFTTSSLISTNAQENSEIASCAWRNFCIRSHQPSFPHQFCGTMFIAKFTPPLCNLSNPLVSGKSVAGAQKMQAEYTMALFQSIISAL
jgi:hypothetical protein